MSPVAQSITVSADPLPFTITSNPPAGGSREPLTLSSWEPPLFDMRLTYAQDQDDVPGKVLLAAALDAGVLPLVINVHGADLGELQDNRRSLEFMFSQAVYTVTLTWGDVSETYDAFPTWPAWTVDLVGLIATATLNVPVNPMGA